MRQLESFIFKPKNFKQFFKQKVTLQVNRPKFVPFPSTYN